MSVLLHQLFLIGSWIRPFGVLKRTTYFDNPKIVWKTQSQSLRPFYIHDKNVFVYGLHS